MNGQPIPILLFADSILGIKTLYDWQAQILLNYEAGNQTAAACANFTGKTSTVSRSQLCGPYTTFHAAASCTQAQLTLRSVVNFSQAWNASVPAQRSPVGSPKRVCSKHPKVVSSLAEAQENPVIWKGSTINLVHQ